MRRSAVSSTRESGPLRCSSRSSSVRHFPACHAGGRNAAAVQRLAESLDSVSRGCLANAAVLGVLLRPGETPRGSDADKHSTIVTAEFTNLLAVLPHHGRHAAGRDGSLKLTGCVWRTRAQTLSLNFWTQGGVEAQWFVRCTMSPAT
ncbi:unnamed protein product [Lampetra planeri]